MTLAVDHTTEQSKIMDKIKSVWDHDFVGELTKKNNGLLAWLYFNINHDIRLSDLNKHKILSFARKQNYGSLLNIKK